MLPPSPSFSACRLRLDEKPNPNKLIAGTGRANTKRSVAVLRASKAKAKRATLLRGRRNVLRLRALIVARHNAFGQASRSRATARLLSSHAKQSRCRRTLRARNGRRVRLRLTCAKRNAKVNSHRRGSKSNRSEQASKCKDFLHSHFLHQLPDNLI